jgi:hypothetical protein
MQGGGKAAKYEQHLKQTDFFGGYDSHEIAAPWFSAPLKSLLKGNSV